MDNQYYIERELEARAKLELEARSLLDRAADENRDLSPEESEQFDKIVAAGDVHKKRAEQLEKMAQAAAVTPEARTVISAASSLVTPTETWDEQLAATIRGMFSGQYSGEVTLPEVKAGRAPFVRAMETVAGIDVPTDFSTRVAVYMRTLSPWVGLATIINGTDGAPIQLPRITADPTTYTPGQGTAITASDPTLSAATATPAGYKALTYISQEMAQDEVIQLMDLIARSQGRSIGLAFGAVVTAAVLSGGTNGGTATGAGGAGTATNTFFGHEDLINLIYGRAAPYRVQGVGAFVMATGAIQKIRKFRDQNYQYLWSPSVAAGQPDTYLGYPVYEDPALATPASATKSVVFGDTTAYVIKQLPLRVAVSSEHRFAEDQVAVKTVYRAGGALPDATALAYLVSANT